MENKTTMTQIRQGLTVSETTALFRDALKLFVAAREKMLDGLIALYGEPECFKIYAEDFSVRMDQAGAAFNEAFMLSVNDRVNSNDDAI